MISRFGNALVIAMSLTKLAAAIDMPQLDKPLTEEQVTAFAQLAIENLEKEFPNKLSHVWTGDEEVHTPREMHPVFYGSFDWHSSVHGHWMLVRLARLYPNATVCSQIRELLDKHFTLEKLRREAKYFEKKSNKAYDRMYGWAWALRLAQELRTWDDPQARRWAENFSVLENKLVELILDYLPRLTYPIRSGTHPNTAFALSMILDYARAVEDQTLTELVINYAKEKYTPDRDYPANYEPSGHDFFSSGLNQADLLRRVMVSGEFSKWLEQFLPGLDSPSSKANKILQPAIVSDLSDPKIVHLVGLNLSRAWTQRGIASVLPQDDARRAALETAAAIHCQAGLKYVFSGSYEGEHWLASFAVYLLTDAGITSP